MSARIAKARHRGLLYPERFSWTWQRHDGLEVLLEVRVDAEAGPVATEVRIRADAGVGVVGGASDYRLPIPSMVRAAAAQYAAEVSGDAASGYTVRRVAAGETLPMGPQGVRRDRDRLERVAELYRQALAEGRGVTDLIVALESVGQSQAYGLIRRARKAGLLPPSRPGRKRRSER